MTPDTEQTRIELIRADDDDKYLLKSELEIVPVLESLIRGRALITAHLSPGSQSFLTAVLEVTREGGLVLDGSADEAINSRMARADEITCITQLHNVRIQFTVSAPQQEALDGRPAFRTALPQTLLRLQRREFYRLHPPVTETVTCSIPVADGAGVGAEVRIIDISAGGVAVAVPPSGFAFEPHMEFGGSTLHLPGAEAISTRLVVRNLFRLVNRNGVEMMRAGCQFLDLPRNADAIIQRYILKIERERNARTRGGY